jgi:hypothetical protein
MGFTGKLGDFGLPEVLQLLASNEKTGKLTLTRRDGHGVIVLRGGRIIYAVSNSVRETIGNILLCRGLIDETTLSQAMERQNRDPGAPRLGAILIEMAQLSPADLEEVMKHQTGTVISELMAWERGFFRFEDMSIPEGGEVEVDATDFLMKEGLKTEQVILEALSHRALPEEAQRGTSGPDEATPLQQIIATEHPPALRGELSSELMNAASGVVKRGLVFAVRRNGVEVVGHFGFDEVPEPELRSLWLSLEGSSILADVVHWKESHQGPLEPTAGNERLLALLGGDPEREVVVVPVVVGESVAMVFYGDNHPSRDAIRETPRLERAMAEIGLTMERQALESKLRHLERQHQDD